MNLIGNLKNRAVGLLREWLNEPPGRDKHLSTDVFTAGDVTPTGGIAGAIVRLVKRMPGAGTDHAAQLFMYAVMREALPVMESAIINRRMLEGEMIVRSKDTGLERDINAFTRNVRVGDVDGEQQQPIIGLESALDGTADNTDGFGLGIVEPKLDENGQDIERILVPNPRTFSYERTNTSQPYRLYQIQDGRKQPVTSPNVNLLGFRFNNNGPWPLPMAWGLPFVSEVAIRMFVSINNLWWRAGDPSQIWSVSYDKDTPGVTNTTLEEDADLLQATVEGILKNRRSGKISDGFIGFKGGTLNQMTVGGNVIVGSLAPYFQEHYNVIASQIIGRSNVPVWMFPEVDQSGEGMGSSRSDHINSLSMAGAAYRNMRKLRIARNIINLWLILSKSASYINRYDLTWESANIRDEKVWEETRKAREEANSAAIENGQRLADLALIEDGKRIDYITKAGVLPEDET